MQDSKETFFATLKEIEQHGVICSTKGRFIDNVLMAKEQITFGVIDRCREAALQLNQSHYVIRTLYEQIAISPLAKENMVRLGELLSTAHDISRQANNALIEISTWVPLTVNTRAHSSAPTRTT
jgi:hypothetical protein